MNDALARVVVVGSTNTDLVVRATRLPTPGETVLGGDFFRAAGGKGANQAVAAARLGAHVDFIARVGDDDFGRAARMGLAEEGLALDHVNVDPQQPSGVALIVVDDRAENQITVAPGANSALNPADVDRALDVLDAARVILVQLEVPMATVERAATEARHRGALVILNPAPAAPLTERLLCQVDVLTPNEHEARQLAGLGDATPAEAARALCNRGVDTVVVTLGRAGCLIVDADGVRSVPGRAVEAIDTTGAGDAFNGALATRLAEGATIDQAAHYATAAAALAVTRAGAQPALPHRHDVDALLAADP